MRKITFQFVSKELLFSPAEVSIVQELGYNQALEVVLLAAMRSKFPAGLDRVKRGILRRLQAGLDSLVTPLDGTADMLLEESEYDFLSGLFLDSDTLIPVEHTRIAHVIETAVKNGSSVTAS